MLAHKNADDILYKLDKVTLKKLCYLVGIKTRVKQNIKLIQLLIFHYASTKIQRVFRMKLIKYNICPITHEFLKYPFVSIRHPNGHFNYYSLDGIASWYRRDKDYICPNTRYKISKEKLREIDYLYYFYHKKKLIKEQKNQKNGSLYSETQDLTWVGRNLIVFVKNLDRINHLSINTIDQVVIPYIMNNLYFILNRNTNYAIVILSLVINIIAVLELENSEYIINQIKEIL